MPSRDSIVWTVVLIGGVLTFLATLPSPVTWTWAQWCGTLAAICGIVGAKLGNSPLLSRNERITQQGGKS